MDILTTLHAEHDRLTAEIVVHENKASLLIAERNGVAFAIEAAEKHGPVAGADAPPLIREEPARERMTAKKLGDRIMAVLMQAPTTADINPQFFTKEFGVTVGKIEAALHRLVKTGDLVRIGEEFTLPGEVPPAPNGGAHA